MWTRIAPVVSLFLLAPLIAEYLLGSLPMSMIGILPIMAALYGSAALLIRDVARRTGGGWGAIALLGLAYGLAEEGLFDQSLFNRDYLHLHLLDYGWLPALGTALPWALYVLTIHVVWSICVPIALTEALFPARRAQPWLGRAGLAIFGLLYLAGAGAVARFTFKSNGFMATPGQLAAAAGLILLVIVAAVRIRAPKPGAAARAAFPAWPLLLGALLAGTGVMGFRYYGPDLGWPWQACALLLAAIDAGFAAAIVMGRGHAWGGAQRLALVLAGLAVYGFFGVGTDLTLHGAADQVPHAVLMLLFTGVAALAVRRVRAEERKDRTALVPG